MSSYNYNKKYAQKYLGTLDELKIRVPKGRKADIESHARKKGVSVNGLINALLRADMGMSDDEWKHTSGDNMESDE